MIKTIARIMIASRMIGKIQMIMIMCIGCIPKDMVFSFLNIFQIEKRYVYYKGIIILTWQLDIQVLYHANVLTEYLNQILGNVQQAHFILGQSSFREIPSKLQLIV
jgi:hypothetical protein